MTRGRLFLLAVPLVLLGCEGEEKPSPSPSGEPPAPAASSPPADARKAPPPPAMAKAPPAAKEDKQASWPAAVRADYEAIRKLPGDGGTQLIGALNKLAAHGRESRAAFFALVADPSVNRRVSGMSAMVLSDLLAFDVDGLRKLLAEKHSMAQLAAIKMLSEIGGSDLRAELTKAVAASPALSKSDFVSKFMADMPAAAKAPPRALTLLQRVQFESDQERKGGFDPGAVLIVDHPQAADWGCRKLAGLPRATKGAQMQCAIVLSRIHAKSFDQLRGLTSPKANKFVRLEAFRALAALGERGKAFARKASTRPGEPLKPHLEKFAK